MEGLKEFLTINYSGDGDGSGDGSGSGDGAGSGAGSGDGDGYGSGSGYGYGSGSGYGSGDGLKSFCGETVSYIDGIPTVITQLKGNIARGYIVKKDLAIKYIYVAKIGNYFAHAESVKKAVADAKTKHLQSSTIESRILEFHKSFDGVEKIPAQDLFDWHFTLTGSCELGRQEFVKQNNVNLNSDSFTVTEFVDITKDAYGGDIVRLLLKH